MNPYKAVAGQSAGLCAALVCAFSIGNEQTFRLLLIAVGLLTVNNLIWAAAYLISRRRFAERTRLTKWRRRGDLLAYLEALAPAAVTACCAVTIGTRGPLSDSFGALTFATVFTALSVMLAAVVGSSMVDWFYIRAFRDGVVRRPPCMSPTDSRWASLTKAWIIHRLVAELAFVLFFVLTGLALVIEGINSDGWGAWVRTAVSAAITVAGIALKYSSARLRIAIVGIPGANRTARFALGETLTWKANANAVIRVRSERRIGVGRFRWHLKRVEEVGKKWPVLHARGQLGYVRDVALDVATILEMNARRDGSVNKELEVPMDVLFHESAVIDRAKVAWCTDRGKCLRLQERCELQTES